MSVLGTPAVLVVAYTLVGALALWVAWVERSTARCRGGDRRLWPVFWLLTALLLLGLAVARLTGLGDLLTELGREQAKSGGWYETRRKYQALVVGAVGVVWFASVLTALWRVPERRRRYLPVVLLVLTIGGFHAARLVSLHQVDGLLYRRDLAAVAIDAVIELSLLVALVALEVWMVTHLPPDRRSHGSDEVPLVGSAPTSRV